MIIRRTLFRLLLLPALCLLADTAPASDLVTYQGRLTDETGAPLPDGQYWIGVRLWDQASGGAVPLWARKYHVPVTGGLFSLMVGAEGTPWEAPEPLTSSLKLATSGGNRWVEITVMSDANGAEKDQAGWKVLLPRQQLNSVPFALNGVPAGTVVPFAGTTVPDGWVLCDGSLLNGADPLYAGLYAVLQTTYGEGEGNEFALPDLRGRTVVGSGQGPGLSDRRLAGKFGSETHALSVAEMPRHNHGGQTGLNGKHSHTIERSDGRTIRWGDGGGNSSDRIDAADSDGADTQTLRAREVGDHRHSISFEGSSTAHPIVQPSLVLHYIIKL